MIILKKICYKNYCYILINEIKNKNKMEMKFTKIKIKKQ